MWVAIAKNSEQRELFAFSFAEAFRRWRVEDVRYRKILSAYIVELGHIGPPSRFGSAVTLGVSKKFGGSMAAWL